MNSALNTNMKESNKRNPAARMNIENGIIPPVSSYPPDLQRQLVSYLSGFMTERRNALFRQIASKRTRYITVVLEDIFQSHNASAVLRSCECFGVQDIHFIENKFQYELNPDIALGSWKWLTLNRYADSEDNTTECLLNLKAQGYRIVATSPHKQDTTPDMLSLDKGKIALIFGTELDGLSEQALALADEFVRIPMVGFTESFNISVSAALCIYQLTDRLRKSTLNWQLDEEETIALLLSWMRNSIKMSKSLENKFVENINFRTK
jgi:tRNA (guanosine-2'-O-)-methyltransferase